AAVGPSRGSLVLSVLAAVLAACTSLAGILWPGAYARETAAWAVQGVGQDVANLPVVVVTLGCAALLRRRASFAALSVWLGCLLYFVYAFAIYAFAVHFNGVVPGLRCGARTLVPRRRGHAGRARRGRRHRAASQSARNAGRECAARRHRRVVRGDVARRGPAARAREHAARESHR